MNGIWIQLEAYEAAFGHAPPWEDEWHYVDFAPGLTWKAVTSADQLERDLQAWKTLPPHWKRLIGGCRIRLRAVPI